MGCGVSRFDSAGGEERQGRQTKYNHGVVISKPLPEDGEGEDDSRGKMKSDGKGREFYNEESSEDDGSYIPHSLSFRVYCSSSLDDNTQGNSNTTNMTDKQEADHGSSKVWLLSWNFFHGF
ncbi:hypothetical protein V6N12_012589 [Hibiscus sabdariffa]|uniref:Uncharacterized protein n=1 Tax=Hibiscus sabdariffa TaxID=183260 RepID=A0ABR2DD13_9ROSI